MSRINKCSMQFITALLAAMFSSLVSANTNDTKGVHERCGETACYEESWSSMAKHQEDAQWLKDAKFGIYFHWGVYSVPAFKNEWYPRNMYIPGTPEFEHHRQTYGNEVHYADFIPQFTGEHFDAEQWARLFKQAGAKFAGPVSEHHDGFSMWDSSVNPWNVNDMGPKVDILGELATALRAQNLKLITTFHHNKQLNRYQTPDALAQELSRSVEKESRRFWHSHYPPYPGTPQAAFSDDQLNILFGNIDEDEWLEKFWFGKLKEVINKYQPDILWFDAWLDSIPENYRLKASAYYLNEALKNNQDVVLIRKQDDLPDEVSIEDLERSRKQNVEERLWMTDAAISPTSWSHVENMTIKKGKDLLHILIDIVSKNGVLLLNISPQANGLIDEKQQDALLEMGTWLSLYGEAIYGTSAWKTFGEGPTKQPKGHYDNSKKFQTLVYSEKDYRFTQKDNVVYVIQLGKTDSQKIRLKSFTEDSKVKSVIAFSDVNNVLWTQNKDGLEIVPPKRQNDLANVYKVTLVK